MSDICLISIWKNGDQLRSFFEAGFPLFFPDQLLLAALMKFLNLPRNSHLSPFSQHQTSFCIKWIISGHSLLSGLSELNQTFLHHPEKGRSNYHIPIRLIYSLSLNLWKFEGAIIGEHPQI